MYMICFINLDFINSSVRCLVRSRSAIVVLQVAASCLAQQSPQFATAGVAVAKWPPLLVLSPSTHSLAFLRVQTADRRCSHWSLAGRWCACVVAETTRQLSSPARSAQPPSASLASPSLSANPSSPPAGAAFSAARCLCRTSSFH